jgi:hypothetical protein
MIDCIYYEKLNNTHIGIFIANFQYSRPQLRTKLRSFKHIFKSALEILEWNPYVTLRWISLTSLKRCASRACFTFGKRKKSAGAKSGEYGGCWITQIGLEARNCFTIQPVVSGRLVVQQQLPAFPNFQIYDTANARV